MEKGKDKWWLFLVILKPPVFYAQSICYEIMKKI